jgi:RimJ/RimL family protein N-acetyltransferase
MARGCDAMLALVALRLVPIDPERPAAGGEGVPFWDETHESLRRSPAHRAWYINDDDDDLLGLIGASHTPDGHQIGYGVAPAHEGRGVTTSAVRLLLDQLRDEGATHVVAETFDDHVASRRVMEKAGMVLVATKREDVDGEERDLVVYELRFPTGPDAR